MAVDDLPEPGRPGRVVVLGGLLTLIGFVLMIQRNTNRNTELAEIEAE